ncbi:MAG: hypothetical protein LBJ38_00050 [Oscillospiraceae bacterium]|nr:hypothetical protein [Oscillospiraceae bacterium]
MVVAVRVSTEAQRQVTKGIRLPAEHIRHRGIVNKESLRRCGIDEASLVKVTIWQNHTDMEEDASYGVQ